MTEQRRPTTSITVRGLSIFLLLLSAAGLYATFWWLPLSFMLPKGFVALFGLVTSSLLLFETHEKSQPNGRVWIGMGLFLIAAVAVGWESPSYFGLLHIFIRPGDLPVLFMAGVTGCLLGLEAPPRPITQRESRWFRLRLFTGAATLNVRHRLSGPHILTPFR